MDEARRAEIEKRVRERAAKRREVQEEEIMKLARQLVTHEISVAGFRTTLQWILSPVFATNVLGGENEATT